LAIVFEREAIPETTLMNPSAAFPAQRISSIAVLLLALVAAGIAGIRAQAQDPAGSSVKEEERKKLDEMQEIARGYKVSIIDKNGKRAAATIGAEPLHRWTDPTREFSGGALWAFRESGRPVAIYGLELYGSSWSHEFVSLSTGRVDADNGEVHWTPSKEGVEFHEVPDAAGPATNAAGRLRQMRDLARQFAARETWEGQTYALRLLPHPIDRYSDPGSGLLDAAVFAYANGTNPELLLLLEATPQGQGPPRWRFAAARLARAELHLKLGPRDVWNAPVLHRDLKLNPNDTYYTTLTPRHRQGGEFLPRNTTAVLRDYLDRAARALAPRKGD
jgi:hypothetical protein